MHLIEVPGRMLRAVADAEDVDFSGGFVNGIEDKIRIAHDRQGTDAEALGWPAAVRVATHPTYGLFDPGLHALCGARVSLSNVGEDLVELSERFGRVADLHTPCLANMAATSASLANSPRRASARASSRSARSSSVSL